MAEHGDHDPEAPGSGDPDAEIGFCTPESLTGERRPEPELRSEPDAAVESDPAPAAEAAPERPAVASATAAAPEPDPVEPGPDWREDLRQAPAAVASPPQARRSAAQTEGATTLYAVYALILFAVPTFGVSALLGLLSVIGRDGPADPLAQSHFLFQRRTLWTAALVAVMGVILIIVGLGVFVLFALALWTIARGAYGVMRLKADRPIDNPRSWLF